MFNGQLLLFRTKWNQSLLVFHHVSPLCALSHSQLSEENEIRHTTTQG